MPIKKITFGSLFKIIVWSQICVWLLFILFLGAVAFMAPGVVIYYDGEAGSAIEGWKNLSATFAAGTAFILLIGGLGAAGLKLFGGILPLGMVTFEEQG